MGDIYVALYNFDVRSEGDLGFKKGDLVELINKTDPNWWLAKHCKTKKSGYIPANYVALNDSLETYFWYAGNLSRVDAERTLRKGEKGTFLVRRSSKDKGYAISVYTVDGEVKHYRIRVNTDGEFYVVKGLAFASIQDLIAHHEKEAEGPYARLGDAKSTRTTQAPQTIGLSKDTWEISRDSIDLQKKLGQGQFGEVYMGVWNTTTPVAVKTLKPGTMAKDAFLKEAALMKVMQHPNLLQLYAVCTETEPMYIVLELMKNGSLLDYLHEKGRSLNLHRLIDMTLQTAAGMAYLESKNFIHRDLAARNVLVGEHDFCKIADFGLARVIETDLYMASAGTQLPVKWSAPEAVTRSQFSIKSDVWSFGVLLMEIMTRGRIPYPGMSNQEVIDRVDAGYRMPCPPECPSAVYKIMTDCWNENPKKRPSFESIQAQLEDAYQSGEIFLMGQRKVKL